MIDKIPTDIWSRNNSSILDPCCGNGNFSIPILFKLLEFHSKKYILENILQFNDIIEARLDNVRSVFSNDKYNLNITNSDFLTTDNNNTYDLIVANPPYAKLLPNGKRASKNHNLIKDFIDKALSLLKPNGYLLFITPEMVNVVAKRCLSEWCYTFSQNDKYDGYCLPCFMHLFPDKPVSRNYKTKEYAVVESVKTENPDVDWVADKRVNGGCSKRRPDLLLDLGYQVIIVEVDENQHTYYDCSCQNKRIMELSQDAGHRPIVFIRFNPDKYVNSDGSKITSCWGTNGKGICVVVKSKEKEWIQRLNCLKESINYWINPENKTNKMVETVQLFYDGWN